jgi:hypothetical protein
MAVDMTSARGARPTIASILTSDIRFGRADLHVETRAGDGEAEPRAILDRVERRDDLDVLAIADRDRLDGALEARELHAAGEYHFELVPGLQVTTADGPLLALWVDVPIAAGAPLEETVTAVHAAGGIAVVPHPFARFVRSISRRALERALQSADPAARPDAIQLTSGSARAEAGARRALELNASRYHLGEVGASGATFPERVATAYTLFPGTLRPGRRAAELRAAIENGTARAAAGSRLPIRRLGWRRVAEQRTREATHASRRTLAPLLDRIASAREVMTTGSRR